MANDKTEKATPKRKNEARDKGQVAKSADLQGAFVLLVALQVFGSVGPRIASSLAGVMQQSFQQIGDPSVVQRSSVGGLLQRAILPGAASVAPLLIAGAMAAIVIGAAQVGIKPRLKVLKPSFKRLNPISGAKNLVGPNALFELGKNLLKVSVMAAVVLGTLLPHLRENAALVGMTPLELGAMITKGLHQIAFRAAMAYLFIGLVDYFYQRHRTEKGMRMDKQEIKDESKGQDLPPEVKGAIRRRQMERARQRMFADVPTADVVVTNPTHYSVALRYDGDAGAPVVIAKGKDLIAFKIRELAAEAGVPIVPDPPLARSLHATVEVGQEIPEELFQAVASVLAYVYRVAGRRKFAS